MRAGAVGWCIGRWPLFSPAADANEIGDTDDESDAHNASGNTTGDGGCVGDWLGVRSRNGMELVGLVLVFV